MSEVVREDRVTELDLVIVIDSDPASSDHLESLFSVIDGLVEPPCLSRSTPGGGAPHRCDPNNPDDFRSYPPPASMRVGVVSADLGARGSGIAGCETERGLDGRIGPRVTLSRQDSLNGAHLGHGSLPPSADTASCDGLPAFLSFCSTIAGCRNDEEHRPSRDPSLIRAQFACHARAAARGCPLSQPLEALWRALVEHGASEPPGSPAPNAGFLRPDALLSIVVFTAGDDHSVRDCSRDYGFSASRGERSCRDGTSAFLPSSTQWSSRDVEQRFYPQQLDSALDPTWNLDRYLDPTGRWTRDLDSLKPGRPWAIQFAAITGVSPLAAAQRLEFDRIDWRSLETSLVPSLDARCGHIAPVCTRPAADGTAPTCRTDGPMALPSRRIVALARRFAESPRCNGAPCNDGIVESACSARADAVIRNVLRRYVPRGGRCLPRLLLPERGTDGLERVSCVVREIMAVGLGCDTTRGRRVIDGDEGVFVDEQGQRHIVCEVDQIPVYPASHPQNPLLPVSDAPGWFYDRTLDPDNPSCTQRISQTPASRWPLGTIQRLECTLVEWPAACRPDSGAGSEG